MQVTLFNHTWPSLAVFLGELAVAFGIVFGVPIAIWTYYIITGMPVNFGG